MQLQHGSLPFDSVADDIRLSPITYLTPSGVSRLLACPLSAALEKAPQVARLRRLTPASALGMTVHRVLERAAAGDLDPPGAAETAVDDAWASSLEDAHLRMAAESHFGEPPPPARWPGYQAARVRCRRRALLFIGAGQHTVHPRARPRPADGAASTPPPAPGRATFVERPLEAFGGRLRGRVDRVEVSDTGTCIVDFKTGSRESGVVTDGERAQLLLYAVLWAEETGRFPDDALIEPLGYSMIRVKLDEVEARDLASRAIAALGALDDLIEGGATPRELAKPSEESCGRCSFRVACPSYWDARSDWDSPVGDVAGTVTSIDGAGIELVAADSAAESPPVRVRGPFLGLKDVESGSRIFLQALARSPSGELTATWRSDYWLGRTGA